MEQANSTLIFKCIPRSVGNITIAITVLILPFHILMIKVLLLDLRLALPRHKILLCLSLSDTMQIFITSLCVATGRIFSLTTKSIMCHITRDIVLFNTSVTVVLSSLAICGLSLERYVACIYSFRLYRIFTKERILFCSLCASFIGLLLGIISITLRDKNSQEVILEDNKPLRVMSMIIFISTSILICIVQIRLFTFSRKKLKNVGHRAMFGSNAEITDLRKKQIKIAFVASIIALAYIVCMLPAACTSVYKLISGHSSHESFQFIVKVLAFINNFINPFIYGIGIADIRKALLKNLRTVRNFCSSDP